MWHHWPAVWTEIKRKFFHLAALIYVVGIIYLPRETYLCILVPALAFVVAVESLRLRRPSVNDWFLRRFGGLFRPEESQRFSGMPWLLAGVTATVALAAPVALTVSAVLYLILGDALASLVGIRFGGPHWPGTRKRLSGSLACFTICLFIGAVILRPEYGWHGVVIGALAATAFEAGLVPLDDNFTIPLGSALVLLLCYGIPPMVGLFR